MVPLTAMRPAWRKACNENDTARVTPWMVKLPVTGTLITWPSGGICGSTIGWVRSNCEVGYLSTSSIWRYLLSCWQWQVTVCMLTTTLTAVTVRSVMCIAPVTSGVAPTTRLVCPITVSSTPYRACVLWPTAHAPVRMPAIGVVCASVEARVAPLAAAAVPAADGAVVVVVASVGPATATALPAAAPPVAGLGPRSANVSAFGLFAVIDCRYTYGPPRTSTARSAGTPTSHVSGRRTAPRTRAAATALLRST